MILECNTETDKYCAFTSVATKTSVFWRDFQELKLGNNFCKLEGQMTNVPNDKETKVGLGVPPIVSLSVSWE